MHVLCAIGTAVLMLLQAPGAGGAARDSANAAMQSLAKVDKALFRIETEDGSGSGFQYRTAGYVVTNKHVVDSTPVGNTVKLRPVKTAADGSVGLGTPFEGTVRFKHPDLDVAVIEIPKTVSTATLVPVATAGAKHVARGVELYAHGFPGIAGPAGSPTISRGMLSAHYNDPLTGQTFYLTDTALSPGSSGGPVTDSSGAVVGIATAVSIVADGAGNSWGYVLPMKAVDDALSCKGGLASLPASFDLAKHVAAIKACRGADRAMEAYRSAIEDAVKRCASPTDLASAYGRLVDALAGCWGAVPRDRFVAYNDASLRAGNALLTRYFELELIDPRERAASALAGCLKPGKLDEWERETVRRSLELVPSSERAVAFAELLSAHAAGVAVLLKAAPSDCGAMQAAAAALQSEAVTNRGKVKAFAKALASLVQTRINLGIIEPGKINPDDADLPIKARQGMRTCKANLQNCLDEWEALPEECRKLADSVLSKLLEGEANAPGAGGKAADRAEGEGQPADGLERWLEAWTNAGFHRWGKVQRGTTEGDGTSFDLTFDEAPAIVWVGVRSPQASDLAVTLTGAGDAKIESNGGARQGDVVWEAFELRTDQPVSVSFRSAKATRYAYEMTVLYRDSPIEAMRKFVQEKMPGMQVYATRSLALGAGESIDYNLEAGDWSEFRLHCFDIAKNDIDIEVVDPDGTVVARDTDDDHLPTVGVENVRRGKYTLRVRNASKAIAFVDSAVFVRPR